MNVYHAKSTITPVIDMSPFWQKPPSEPGPSTVTKLIGDACEHMGFFIIVNHRVPPQLISQMQQVTQNYFDLPTHEKKKVPMTSEYPYGYSGNLDDTISRVHYQQHPHRSPDLNESFSIGPYNPGAGLPPIRWPTQPFNMKSVWLSYYQEMEQLASDLLSCFALALGLPKDWFEDKITHHRSALKALSYPALPTTFQAAFEQLRAGVHTDYGTFTILLQDDMGGLHVQNRAREWISVPFIPGSFVINIGDLVLSPSLPIYCFFPYHQSRSCGPIHRNMCLISQSSQI